MLFSFFFPFVIPQRILKSIPFNKFLFIKIFNFFCTQLYLLAIEGTKALILSLFLYDAPESSYGSSKSSSVSNGFFPPLTPAYFKYKSSSENSSITLQLAENGKATTSRLSQPSYQVSYVYQIE